MMKLLSSSLMLIGTILLCGCGHILDDMGLRDETVYPPAMPIDHPPPPKTKGTIYQSGYEVSLYSDHIAHHTGDILTVRLEEVTQGEKKAKTKTSKVTTNVMQTPVLFGGSFNPLTFNTNNDMEFDGEGDSNQQNKLKGTVSVTVMRILANGNLFVQGESWVTIDQGREYIRLLGMVRPEDIEPNNVVSSQRVAGARIAYSGTGQVGNVSRGGPVTQLFTKFFPY
jgi:flagellar L-ring protein FlgH